MHDCHAASQQESDRHMLLLLDFLHLDGLLECIVMIYGDLQRELLVFAKAHAHSSLSMLCIVAGSTCMDQCQSSS